MFESSLSFCVTEWANKTKVDEDYHKCWQPLTKNFSPPGSSANGRCG